MCHPMSLIPPVVACATALCCLPMHTSARDPGKPAGEGQEVSPTPLTLSRITEIRASIVGDQKANEDEFIMSSETPGLTLTFSLRLPDGVKVMEVHQPAAVVAKDSEGTDLAKIEPRFGDEFEYVDLEHDFDDDDSISEITLHLAPTARKATTFDVAAAFEVMVYTGVKRVQLEVGKDWSDMPADNLPAGIKARIRLTEDGFAIEPASLESTIDKIEIQSGQNEVVDSNGWFSDGSVITYMFDDLPAETPVKATMTVRTGMNALPLAVDLKGQTLP